MTAETPAPVFVSRDDVIAALRSLHDEAATWATRYEAQGASVCAMAADQRRITANEAIAAVEALRPVKP